MSLERPLESLSDDEVLASLHDLLRQSRRVEAPLVAHIGEVHARHLYARYAVSSMFSYCTSILHLSEGEAQLRIKVAQAARDHPVLLEMLADGRLHLSGISKLAAVLTIENRDALVARATYKSKREIEEIVAEMAPRPDVPSVIRKLPERAVPSRTQVPVPVEVTTSLSVDASESDATRLEAGGSDAPPADVSRSEPPRSLAFDCPARRAVFEPLSPSRYKVQFTAGPEVRDDLEHLKALMRSQVPDGDIAEIIGRAVREMRARLEARRYARTKSPREPKLRKATSSRPPAAWVRRVVYERDGRQCRFVDAQGRRCPARHGLQYHHQDPYARGGSADPKNICLMCHAHNQFLAERDYGRQKMSRYRRSTPASDRRNPEE
jgi:hypothetical protein